MEVEEGKPSARPMAVARKSSKTSRRRSVCETMTQSCLGLELDHHTATIFHTQPRPAQAVERKASCLSSSCYVFPIFVQFDSIKLVS